MINIKKYSDEDKVTWNNLCNNSKTPLFMFNREYMEYHSDRFKDHSLMFYDDEELVAILPISETNEAFSSHGGLTYGGFICANNMKQHTMNDCMTALIEYARGKGKSQILYKSVPHMYHLQPAEEDRYALFVNGAKLKSVEATTVINLRNPLKMPKGRKAQISRAKREGVIVEERKGLDDYKNFIDLENLVLRIHHNTQAVHTGEELYLLHDRFPNNIRLYTAIHEKALIAGVIIYEYEKVIHTQYMAANDKAREIGALDYIINEIIQQKKLTKEWLDFGISTENGGLFLNEGLISQKEGFGGRTNVYEKWIINL